MELRASHFNRHVRLDKDEYDAQYILLRRAG